MIKYVIRFPDGMYWRAYNWDTADINEAWTFNKSSRARWHAEEILGIQGVTIVSYEVR